MNPSAVFICHCHCHCHGVTFTVFIYYTSSVHLKLASVRESFNSIVGNHHKAGQANAAIVSNPSQTPHPSNSGHLPSLVVNEDTNNCKRCCCSSSASSTTPDMPFSLEFLRLILAPPTA
ncbi:hypothetical protein LIA77_06989 [Sarocladium implicatum]|nr:hypothetical protein LIA77_06989 [Sarocladium implicatum]